MTRPIKASNIPENVPKKEKRKRKQKLTVNSLCERMVLLRKTECKHADCDSLWNGREVASLFYSLPIVQCLSIIIQQQHCRDRSSLLEYNDVPPGPLLSPSGPTKTAGNNWGRKHCIAPVNDADVVWRSCPLFWQWCCVTQLLRALAEVWHWCCVTLLFSALTDAWHWCCVTQLSIVLNDVWHWSCKTQCSLVLIDVWRSECM